MALVKTGKGEPAVIMLDGNQRSALAATRSLGRRGIHVVVGAESRKCLASSSRYCCESFAYPPPDSDPAAFLGQVLKVAEQHRNPVLFPMTDLSLNEILLHRDRFPGNVTVPFPSHERYDALSDKESLFRQALEMGIAMPKTLFSSDFRNMEELVSEAERIGFPLVVKAAHSRERLAGEYVSSSAVYVKDPEELRIALRKEPFRRVRCLVQERIRGAGLGVFLLARHGEILAEFAHLRIREKPPSGGVSVLSESIRPPADALDAARCLLAANAWHGVAMVEFKRDETDGRPKLIEVNGRFWGSLNLSIRAGVDFPFLLYRMAVGEPVEADGRYRVGLRSRWELGDLDHLLIRWTKDPGDPSVSGVPVGKWRATRSFLSDFFRISVVNEVFQWHDPGPFFREAADYLRRLAAHA